MSFKLKMAIIKKHCVISALIFLTISGVCLMSNFISWDETELEKSLISLPLGIGFILQLPFFKLLSPWPKNLSYFSEIKSFLIVLPLITGFFYAMTYHALTFSYFKITSLIQSKKTVQKHTFRT